MNILKKWFGKPFRLTDAEPFSLFYGGGSHAGKPVTVDTALQLSTFWACVKITAGVVSAMPLVIYEKDGKGGRNVIDHPLSGILSVTPDGERTAIEFWEAMVAWMLVSGNAYAEIVRSGKRIVALNHIPSDQMQVVRDQNQELRYVFTENGVRYELAADSVLHLKGFGFGGDMGLSVVRYGVQTFGSAIAAEEASGKLLGNGLMPSGILETDQAIDDEQRAQLTKIMQAYSSSSNAGKIMILEAGLKFNQLSLNPEDGQLLQTRSFAVEDICRWFNLPPVVVGHAANGVTAWGSGIEQLILQWLTSGLNNVCTRIEKRILLQLIPRNEWGRVYAEFNRESLLQMDSAAKIAFLSSAVQNGLMTRNESRAKLNLPRDADPASDQLTVQTNLAPLDKLGQTTDPRADMRRAIGLEDDE
jgi:HK97 family phage portal protein